MHISVNGGEGGGWNQCVYANGDIYRLSKIQIGHHWLDQFINWSGKIEGSLNP